MLNALVRHLFASMKAAQPLGAYLNCCIAYVNYVTGNNVFLGFCTFQP